MLSTNNVAWEGGNLFILCLSKKVILDRDFLPPKILNDMSFVILDRCDTYLMKNVSRTICNVPAKKRKCIAPRCVN